MKGLVTKLTTRSAVLNLPTRCPSRSVTNKRAVITNVLYPHKSTGPFSLPAFDTALSPQTTTTQQPTDMRKRIMFHTLLGGAMVFRSLVDIERGVKGADAFFRRFQNIQALSEAESDVETVADDESVIEEVPEGISDELRAINNQILMLQSRLHNNAK